MNERTKAEKQHRDEENEDPYENVIGAPTMLSSYPLPDTYSSGCFRPALTQPLYPFSAGNSTSSYATHLAEDQTFSLYTPTQAGYGLDQAMYASGSGAQYAPETSFGQQYFPSTTPAGNLFPNALQQVHPIHHMQQPNTLQDTSVSGPGSASNGEFFGRTPKSWIIPTQGERDTVAAYGHSQNMGRTSQTGPKGFGRGSIGEAHEVRLNVDHSLAQAQKINERSKSCLSCTHPNLKEDFCFLKKLRDRFTGTSTDRLGSGSQEHKETSCGNLECWESSVKLVALSFGDPWSEYLDRAHG